MNFLTALSLTVLVSFFCQQAHSQHLKKLGQRPSSCKSTDTDSFDVDIAPSLIRETQNLFSDDKLSQLIVRMPSCFRVGTEVRLSMSSQTIGFLGRGYINSIEIIKAAKLKAKATSYTKETIEAHLKKSKAREYAILNIDVSEKVTDTFVDTQYGRLPTCFPTYSDWETHRLPEAPQGDILAQEIQSGQRTAEIWNGTFNCYKVGKFARLTIAKATPQDLGSIVPKELYLIHYTNLKQKHATLVGESLSALKKRLQENKDKDGGYTTMVVYDYLPPKPVPAIINQ